MSDRGALLSIAGVTFGYPRCPEFLGPIDVELTAPKVLGLVGPNGAGKSTLLRLMVGLLRPHAGAIRVLGRAVRGGRPGSRTGEVSFLPQLPPAPPDMRVLELVLWGRYPKRRNHFFDSPDDVRAAEHAMRATECLDFAERTLETLSAGERQRVHLAAALAPEPRMILLDEPTANLDPYHGLRIFELLTQQCREHAITAVVVTHDLNLAGRFCDELLLMASGKVVARGSADDVFQSESLERAYGVAFHRSATTEPRRPIVVPVQIQQTVETCREQV